MVANQGVGERGLYCRFCGKKNEPDSLFCINCGKPMDITPAPQQAPVKPTDDFQAAQNQQATATPQQAPIEMPQAPITPADDFSSAQATAQQQVPNEMPQAPITPADDFFVAQNQQATAAPQQAQPTPPRTEVPPQKASAPHGPSSGKKEPRSFESIGQSVGKKVDELTRSGNVKVKEFSETIDDDKAIEYSYMGYLISAIVAIIAPFLPYIKAGAFGLSINFNYVRIPPEVAEFAGDAGQWGDGIFLIIIAAASIVAWKLKNRVAMLVTGSGAALFSLFAMSQVQKAKELIADTIADTFVQMGIGYYLCILASIALLAFGFVYYYKTKEAIDKKTE